MVVIMPILPLAIMSILFNFNLLNTGYAGSQAAGWA
jgi:hypothetical protein